MNRSTFALFVALLIHIIILLLIWVLTLLAPQEKREAPEEKKLKISLKELPIKDKKSGLKKEKTPPPPKEAPPMPKGSQLKKITKEEPLKLEPKKPVVEPKLNKPKREEPAPKPKPKTEPLPPKKPFIPLLDKKEPKKELPKKEQEHKKTEEKKTKEDVPEWLYEDKSTETKEHQKIKSKNGSNVSSNLKELYGEEFGKLTAGQQKYLLDNQEIMRRITQQVLNRVASVNLDRNLNVNRNNVIEFYLHPNGDMTDFRFISKSGYFNLDDITRETIEYAYAKYPRPTEKTLIRYNVYYHLSRY